MATSSNTGRPGIRVLKRLLLVLGALGVIGFAALIAANWRDAPLTPAAQEALQYTPPSEEALADNGYLIIMGLDAPDEGDAVANAMALGRKRLAREVERRRWVEAHGDQAHGMPPAIAAGQRSEGILASYLRCTADEPNCFDWHGRHRTENLAAAQANRVKLQRLSAAANARQFSNPTPFYLQAELLPFAELGRAHELWLAHATLQWMDGHPQHAMDSLGEASRLRSRLGSSSNSLTAAMVGLSLQRRELRWYSDAIAHTGRRMPDTASDGIEHLLSIPPASLHSGLEGEKHLMASVLYSLATGDPAAAPADSPFWWQRLRRGARSLTYLPHETLNMHISHLQQIQDISRLPAHEMEAAFSALLLQVREESACPHYKHLRNLAGRCLADTNMQFYESYLQRVADMEGYRRLVLLQLRASAEKVALPDMPAWLALSPGELRNPYTLQPMQWDAASSQLVFEGHEPRNHSRTPTYRIHVRISD